MRCADCKFYQGYGEVGAWYYEEYKKYDKGTCNCPKFINGDDRACGDTKDYPLNDKLEYDGDGDGADFVVGKNFGCIHFIKK